MYTLYLHYITQGLYLHYIYLHTLFTYILYYIYYIYIIYRQGEIVVPKDGFHNNPRSSQTLSSKWIYWASSTSNRAMEAPLRRHRKLEFQWGRDNSSYRRVALTWPNRTLVRSLKTEYGRTIKRVGTRMGNKLRILFSKISGWVIHIKLREFKKISAACGAWITGKQFPHAQSDVKHPQLARMPRAITLVQRSSMMMSLSNLIKMCGVSARLLRG